MSILSNFYVFELQQKIHIGKLENFGGGWEGQGVERGFLPDLSLSYKNVLKSRLYAAECDYAVLLSFKGAPKSHIKRLFYCHQMPYCDLNCVPLKDMFKF